MSSHDDTDMQQTQTPPSHPPHRPTLQTLVAICLVVLFTLPLGCGRETPSVTVTFDAFGDMVDVKMAQVERAQAEEAADGIRSDFAALEQDLNTWTDGSMAMVNRLLPTGESFVAPASVLSLVRLSQRYSDLSDGRFNPAIGKLVALWGFNVEVPEGMRPPPDHAIGQLLKAHPQMSDIQIDGSQLRGLNSSLRLDFAPLIRAYAIDLAIGRLRAAGVRHAQVQSGSDVRAIGNRSGQPWRVPIPRATGSGVFATLNIQSGESVVTRAAHDRDWIYQGVAYHQILNPRNGRPARASQSVTVVHDEATPAAAAAIALFVAGPEEWHRVATALGVRHVILADSEGTVHITPELRERLKIVDRTVQIEVSPPIQSATSTPLVTATTFAALRQTATQVD